MKLARIIYRNNSPWWVLADMKVNPPIGTTVQYECDINEWYYVYFPGVQEGATMSGRMFGRYFRDLDDEIS